MLNQEQAPLLLDKESRTQLGIHRFDLSAFLFNFTETALKHLNNPARAVPVQTLADVIEHTEGIADPQGADALMYYALISRNGEPYNLEVLYDTSTNTILHVKYSRQAMGTLPAISK